MHAIHPDLEHPSRVLSRRRELVCQSIELCTQVVALYRTTRSWWPRWTLRPDLHPLDLPVGLVELGVRLGETTIQPLQYRFYDGCKR